MYENDFEEEQRRARRALKMQQMKKEKQRAILIEKCIKVAVPAVILLLFILFISSKAGCGGGKQNTLLNENTGDIPGTHDEIPNTEGGTVSGNVSAGDAGIQENATGQGTDTEQKAEVTYSAKETADTLRPGEELVSGHAIFIDMENGEILAEKDAYTTISPASMTKVLTILVAAEHITEEQLDDTFTFTLEVTDYAYVNDCSCVGFLKDETVTVRDLFYGTILPSGADAAVGLAIYVAGSQDAFVELMNDKLEELGLSETAHFTNCVGVYNAEHYCTLYDMAMIMEAALDNDFCKQVMSAHTYNTTPTEQHSEGLLLSNWFLRRIEDQDTGGEVICGKTGFVNQSGSCAVSYGMDGNGREYLCATANATSSWQCIYDQTKLYAMFAATTEE